MKKEFKITILNEYRQIFIDACVQLDIPVLSFTVDNDEWIRFVILCYDFDLFPLGMRFGYGMDHNSER